MENPASRFVSLVRKYKDSSGLPKFGSGHRIWLPLVALVMFAVFSPIRTLAA
jgi:hypothetical protein